VLSSHSRPGSGLSRARGRGAAPSHPRPGSDLSRGTGRGRGARWLLVAALVVGLAPAGPARAADGPVTVTGDNRRSVDITVRADGHTAGRAARPRRPAPTDAPEQWDDACHVSNAAAGSILCLAGAGGVPPTAPGTVAALAVEARSRLTLPLPAPFLRPLVRFADGGSGGLTGTPTWLWIDPAHWSPTGAPLVREARAGALSAVVSAAPVRMVWRTGDGATVTCRTAGTPLVDARRGPAGSPDCGHTYRRTSAAQPGGRYRMTIGVVWAVTWAGSDGSRGALAPLVVTTARAYTVREGRAQLVGP